MPHESTPAGVAAIVLVADRRQDAGGPAGWKPALRMAIVTDRDPHPAFGHLLPLDAGEGARLGFLLR